MSEKMRKALEDTRAQMFREATAKLSPEYQMAETLDDMCSAEDDGFRCTCKVGHGGDEHIALGMLGRIGHRWPKGKV